MLWPDDPDGGDGSAGGLRFSILPPEGGVGALGGVGFALTLENAAVWACVEAPFTFIAILFDRRE
jgi:hypothetical protein